MANNDLLVTISTTQLSKLIWLFSRTNRTPGRRSPLLVVPHMSGNQWPSVALRSCRQLIIIISIAHKLENNV